MLEMIPSTIGQALKSIRPGLEKIVYQGVVAPETIRVTSEAFVDQRPMPARFTADGAKVSPPLMFEGVPKGALTLALIVEDADSPSPSPLCHALVWGIEGRDGGLQESAFDADAMPTTRRGGVLGKNSFFARGWMPPDPPPGHGAHRYAFQVYALDYYPILDEGAGRGAVVQALESHVLAKGLLIGTYER